MLFNFGKKTEQDSKKEVPRELPSLARDIIRRREAQKQETPIEKTNTAAEIKSSTPPETPPEQPLQTAHIDEIESPQEDVLGDYSYFSKLVDTIKTETDGVQKAANFYKDGQITGDLLDGMKDHWDKQKGNVLFTTEEKKLREHLLTKISTLKNLEKDWQNHHLELVKKEEQIRTEELDLKKSLGEFKSLCKRHIKQKFEKEVGSTAYFILNDGRTLKNLKDLAEATKTMSEETFYHHVTPERNDFANWVKNVIKDDKLAKKISRTHTQEEMVCLF